MFGPFFQEKRVVCPRMHSYFVHGISYHNSRARTERRFAALLSRDCQKKSLKANFKPLLSTEWRHFSRRGDASDSEALEKRAFPHLKWCGTRR
jgi:hypothetical protein